MGGGKNIEIDRVDENHPERADGDPFSRYWRCPTNLPATNPVVNTGIDPSGTPVSIPMADQAVDPVLPVTIPAVGQAVDPILPVTIPKVDQPMAVFSTVRCTPLDKD